MKTNWAKEAAQAHTHLCIFGSIIAILEGGAIRGHIKSAEKIIKICLQEQQRQLRIYDKALSKLTGGKFDG